MPENRFSGVFANAKPEPAGERFTFLLQKALELFPSGVEKLKTVTSVRMRKRGEMKGLVGLTTYCCIQTERAVEGPKRAPTQKITFYSELLNEISDKAAIGVIAHELAHAWLNEHVRPDSTVKREKEADDLARKWGYGVYLDALAEETEPL